MSKEIKMGKAAKKKFCKWTKKDVKEDFDKFADLIKKPTHICGKCGWVSNKKSYLHDPKKIK